MEKPESREGEQVGRVMHLLEDEITLIRIIRDELGDEKISVRIGGELRHPDAGLLSLVTAPYRFGDLSGALAVIGPTRMPYEKIIATLDCTAEILSETLAN